MLTRALTYSAARRRVVRSVVLHMLFCLGSAAPVVSSAAQSNTPAGVPRQGVEQRGQPRLVPGSEAPAADPLLDTESDTGLERQAPDAQAASGYAPQSGGSPMPATGEATPPKLDVNVGGGLILFYYQPLRQGYKNYFEIFEARLRLDAKYGRYRMHITPRFRNTLERDFYPGVSWVEEAYMAAEFGTTIVKVGKVYRQFGRFWDNSFMGNVQEYDGLKLDMDHGVSWEGTLHEKEQMGLSFALQYFVIDGTTNYSLPGRDTLSIPGARRRNQVVGRVEPFYKISDTVTAKLGLSEEYFQADLPAPVGKQDVTRTAVDATISAGALTAWAEFTRQWGRHTTEFPYPSVPAMGTMAAIPGRSSNRNNYVLVGGEYTYDLFTVRYNFSMGDYREVHLTETRHVPGLSVKLNEHLMVLLEWSYVQHYTANTMSVIDSALALTFHGKF
jgi:hypothetical protein